MSVLIFLLLLLLMVSATYVLYLGVTRSYKYSTFYRQHTASSDDIVISRLKDPDNNWMFTELVLKQNVNGLHEYPSIRVTPILQTDARTYAGSKRVSTFELEYPRMIHSEFLTHRVMSKNASSSRAIPFWKSVKNMLVNPAITCGYNRNKAGMQGGERITGIHSALLDVIWYAAMFAIIPFAALMYYLGVHKQIVNRMLEPWTNIKVIVTTTELSNFFKLRNHEKAQPEIRALARLIQVAYNEDIALQPLPEHGYHIPFAELFPVLRVNGSELPELNLTALVLGSVSLLAQTSYRAINMERKQAFKIWDMLTKDDPMHASPLEHVCKPVISEDSYKPNNLIGFNQIRHMVEREKHIPGCCPNNPVSVEKVETLRNIIFS